VTEDFRAEFLPPFIRHDVTGFRVHTFDQQGLDSLVLTAPPTFDIVPSSSQRLSSLPTDLRQGLT
jgi:hypothetical protein